MEPALHSCHCRTAGAAFFASFPPTVSVESDGSMLSISMMTEIILPSVVRSEASLEDKHVLQLYHRLNAENQECIRGMMIALNRQEQLSTLLQNERESL